MAGKRKSRGSPKRKRGSPKRARRESSIESVQEPEKELTVVDIIKSAKGNPQLIDSHNHRYRYTRKPTDEVVFWRCVKDGCRKRLETDPNHNNQILGQFNQHSHLADAREYDKNKIYNKIKDVSSLDGALTNVLT